MFQSSSLLNWVVHLLESAFLSSSWKQDFSRCAKKVPTVVLVNDNGKVEFGLTAELKYAECLEIHTPGAELPGQLFRGFISESKERVRIMEPQRPCRSLGRSTTDGLAREVPYRVKDVRRRRGVTRVRV
jgi:hypothetical protein